MMYVQPVLPPSPMEAYPSYAEPAPVLDQAAPQLYADAGRMEVHQVPLEAPANGEYLSIRTCDQLMRTEGIGFQSMTALACGFAVL